MAFFLRLEVRDVLIVVPLELLGRDRDLLHHLSAREHGILGLDLLRHKEFLLVHVVVSLGGLVVRIDLCSVVRRFEQ